ncbi:hypothetical protein RND81_14G089600 [Saponaria officinalis]|uniref:Reverse transcriptase zinc-binding domain-containing protein n=1 Tax=Saponaria officinalis TaxID=3572 RepID=A0AAW1GNJ1_SAPOF
MMNNGPNGDIVISSPVSVLQKDGGKAWNEDVIRYIFNENWCAKILVISISLSPSKDRYYWLGSNTRDFSVKSGYGLALDYFLTCKESRKDISRVRDDLRWFFKKCLWSLPGPGTNCLPLGVEFLRRNMLDHHNCVLCGSTDEMETYSHLFRDCEFSKRL